MRLWVPATAVGGIVSVLTNSLQVLHGGWPTQSVPLLTSAGVGFMTCTSY